MHALIFWGVAIQVIGTLVNLLQYPLFTPFTINWPRGNTYLAFELVMDLAGLMILLGVAMAAGRRWFRRPKYLPNRWDDWLALALLAVIAVLGFLTEGVRLQTADPAWRAWSPIGNLTAQALSAVGIVGATSLALHQFLLWGHIASGLGLLVSIPFTKMRHLVAGPLNIFLRPQRRSGELGTIADIESTEKLGVGQVDEFSPQMLMSFDACVQCGRCESVCPATASGMAFSPRDIVRGLFESLHREVTFAPQGMQAKPLLGSAIGKEAPWMCTTCGACLAACPLFIDPVASIVDLRRYVTMTTGDVPGSVGEALTQMERRGNPWGLPKENHAPWARELGVRVLQPGQSTDVLLFVGCAAAYDARSQMAARDFATLLQKAGVDFAILGTAEGCCGETARRLGHEYLFQTMAQQNVATLRGVTFKRIVSTCAHCYNTLRNEYPHFGGEFQVVHHTQFLAELVGQGRLKWNDEANGKVYTLHDSCYLARYNNVIQEPRRILDRLPGMQRREMPRREENTFCCGGGGGQMWMETDPNTRINQRRLEEAVQTGADVVVAACPYCLIMFDDAIRSKGISDKVSVKEIAEVVAAHAA